MGGLLGTLGSAVGTFFGGPIGGALGGALGGSIDQENSAYTASKAQGNTNTFNAEQAQINRDWQAGQAQTNRDFQAQQSGSSWQRGVKDMEAAGLNPMLAYSQGGNSAASGSSPSGGSQASSQNVQPQAVQAHAAITQANNQTMIQQAQIDNINADTNLKNAQVPKTEADTNLSWMQGQQAQKLIDKMHAEIQELFARENLHRSQGDLAYANQKAAEELRSKYHAEYVNLGLTSGQITAAIQKIVAETANEKLLTPGLRNAANAEESTWSKTGRPYLKDIGTITNSASQLNRSFKGLK